jgi:transcriptional regulator with XRE-family HTH domain
VVVETVRMPRPNPPRQPGVEDVVARRIAAERAERGWSYADLAGRVTEAGCPIGATAVWKIEQEENRRRVTVDEALAFARVFGIPLLDFLGLSFEVAGVPKPVISARLDALLARIGQIDAQISAETLVETNARSRASSFRVERQEILAKIAELRAQLHAIGDADFLYVPPADPEGTDDGEH